ncbi:lysophospholipid acyltransferase family protein [Limoniibacter endophyticus]|uniref:1-acyl-sn-glycerol-3-phosphate acyltransferase n=1 Tax=Limoniibacter endophyticus TaxID=1565040 RepID=A0A8J3GHG3_9HYPH|nr:lysophospholipid acyltransferase family protein [Limoniibacter endophyticus]GHC74623.1 1-acyl-sn-glycerol-3-phosphate acyltransferase [Limoniibacter endophyticus]
MIGNLRLAVVLIVLLMATLILMPVQILAVATGFPDPRAIPQFWHRLALRCLGLRIRLRGKLRKTRPLMIAANHVSWADIVVLGALVPASFIAKSDIAEWPLIGILAKLQRSIFVERTERRKAAAQAAQIAQRLQNEDVMVLFAEGTTGDGSSLLPFKSTLFEAPRMVLGEEVESILVQPVSIIYTRMHGIVMSRSERIAASWIGDTDLLPHLLRLLREGGADVEVSFGEPIRFDRQMSRKVVAKKVQDNVAAMMAVSLRDPL